MSGLVSMGGVLATSDVAWADKTIPLEVEENYPIEEAGEHPVYPESDKTYATNVRFGYGNTSGESAARVYYLIGSGEVTVSKNVTVTLLDNIKHTEYEGSLTPYNVFNINYTDPGYKARYIYGTRQVFDGATIIGAAHDIPGRQNWLQDGYIDGQGKEVYFLPGDVSGGHVVIDGASVRNVYGGSTSGGAVNKDGITTTDNITGSDNVSVPKGSIVIRQEAGDTYVYCKNNDGTYKIIRGYYQAGEPIPDPLQNINFFSANNNIVEIKNGAKIGKTIADVLCGGGAGGDANYNAVYIENSTSNVITVENCVAGNSNHGSADGNTFIAYKSDIKGVMGGHSDNDMAGGSASVSNNTVIIVGSKTGLQTFMVNGGRVPTIKGDENYKEKIQAGKANNNRVILVGKGGVWSGEVNYGSAQPQRMAFANTGDSALAPKIDNVGVGVANGESKGNRLDIYGTGTEIGIIQNDMVQSVNFYIQNGLNPSENMLNVITCFGEDTIYINEAGKYSTGYDKVASVDKGKFTAYIQGIPESEEIMLLHSNNDSINDDGTNNIEYGAYKPFFAEGKMETVARPENPSQIWELKLSLKKVEDGEAKFAVSGMDHAEGEGVSNIVGNGEVKIYANKAKAAEDGVTDAVNAKEACNIWGVGPVGSDNSASLGKVTMNGGTVNDIIGGRAKGNGKAQGNTVTMLGGTAQNICGGYAENGNAESNEIFLNGGKVEGTVTGGYSVNGIAKNNIIYLNGADTSNAILQGGNDASRSVGNILHVATKGNKAKGINNFNNFNFVINNVNYDAPLLTVTGMEKVDLAGVAGKVQIDGAPASGATPIALLKNTSANGKIENLAADKWTINKGATLTYEVSNSAVVAINDAQDTLELNFKLITKEEKEKEEERKKSPVNENGKSVVETRAAAAAIVNGAADFMLDAGIGQARAAVNEASAEDNNGMVPFVAMGGSNMRYETGSHVDMKGWNAAGGFAKQAGKFMYGVAFEYGRGGYDSYLDNGVHASGDVSSTGGVLFGNAKQADGVHYDAAFRMGRVKSDYTSDVTSYDDGATYIGFSIGGGKEFKVSASDSVDVYGRYYYTRTNGSDVSLATHEQVLFDAVDSHRLRVGARYMHDADEKNQFYAGVAWQYEMGGDAKATINGYGAPVPSLKGHSGMLELGWKAQAADNVKLDLNLNGWLGKQRGIAGGVGAEFAF